mmetsp:Transcript_31916/g.48235  ORF Transcript_31916/g.48235 Transcript_31916/m.48235 type:complete len:142 (-) Transcript_31916:1137-1562(-)
MPARLSKEDETDIRASFEVLDEEKTGFIDLDRLYVLWIGLGFARNVSLHDLSIYIPENKHEAINLDDVIRVISMNDMAIRDREAETKALLELVGEDGKVLPSHLVALAQDSGDSLTIEEAVAAFGGKAYWGIDDLRNFMLS